MTTTLAPCAQEDSTNCYWDALHMGNGQGTGFVDIDGTTFPLVNEPSWNVTVTAVHYNCEDFTLPECQPYADYAPVTAEVIYEEATTPYIDTLAATGPADYLPGLASIAMVLILGGLALKKLARR